MARSDNAEHGESLGLRGTAVKQHQTDVYAREVLGNIPRILSGLDREPNSISLGSFDREHWGWKFRDFPITMLQLGLYPLALLWRHGFSGNPYHRNAPLLEWIEAAIEYTCSRQRGNGSFDSLAPHTQDHGITLQMVYALTETTRSLGSALGSELHARVCEMVRRACQFSFQSREGYAFISNHRGWFALAYLNASELLGDPSYRYRADEVIEEILSRQSVEGWYREYEGADPGYESLGIFYLAMYWRRTGAPGLLESLRRSVAFYSHCVHPDGSVGGAYGSRHTSLYFPGGFEILAREIPMAAAIARFMGNRLARRNVLTPATSDAMNLPVLAYTYLEALLASSEDPRGSLPPLPCESLEAISHFPEAGISAVGRPQYYAIISTAKGGVCRVFDKQAEKIAYEDAGYVVKAGERRYASQLIGFGQLTETSDADEIACTTRFSEVRQELPTAGKFLVLRLLNLTLFRSVRLGAWFVQRIIARLITAKRPGPLRLERSVTFAARDIRFVDRVNLLAPIHVDGVELARSFTAIHMGSTKYFYPAELVVTPRIDAAKMTRDLKSSGAFECRFRVELSSISGARLLPDNSGPGLEAQPPAQPVERIDPAS